MEFVDALSLKPRRVRKTYVTVSDDDKMSNFTLTYDKLLKFYVNKGQSQSIDLE